MRVSSSFILALFVGMMVLAFGLTVASILTITPHESLWHHRIGVLSVFLWAVGGLGSVWTLMVSYL